MGEKIDSIQQKFQCLNGFQLKVLAIICMTIDHIGYVLYPQYGMLRNVGRLAFPIFAFLIVEGMVHTKDAKMYLARLGAFALISEIPFDYAFRGSYWYPSSQNVFFTLFIGALCIYIYQRSTDENMTYIWFAFLCLLAHNLHTDYGAVGVLLVVSLYLARGKIFGVLASLVIVNVLLSNGIQKYAALAFFPLALYNGEKGGGNKYFFYVYYPAHLVILGMVSRLWF